MHKIKKKLIRIDEKLPLLSNLINFELRALITL